MDICRDLTDNGRLDGTYTQQDYADYMAAWQHDPQLQGYCPAVIVPPTTTVTTTTTTPGTTTGTTTTTPTTTSTTTNGTTSTSGVAGTTTTKTGGGGGGQGPVTAGVAGQQKTKTSPQQATPLSATQTGGTLPFTGAELAVFAVVGAALLAGGLLLRLTARQKRGTRT